MHSGKVPGGPKGNRKAWKHGNYSLETMMGMAMMLITDARECAYG